MSNNPDHSVDGLLIPPHFDSRPTKYGPPPVDEPVRCPPAPACEPILDRRQWQYLIGLGVSLVLGLLLQRYGLTPAPLPPGFIESVKEEQSRTAAALQRIESQQIQVMRAAGVPQQ